jgi:hypothetical protein
VRGGRQPADPGRRPAAGAASLGGAAAAIAADARSAPQGLGASGGSAEYTAYVLQVTSAAAEGAAAAPADARPRAAAAGSWEVMKRFRDFERLQARWVAAPSL